MHARYYHPYLKRWAQADTIVPSPADPQDLNRYAYVGGNPLRLADPTGHYDQDKVHYNVTLNIAYNAARSVLGQAHPNLPPHVVNSLSVSIAESIAEADRNTDHFSLLPGSTTSIFHRPELGGQIPEQYYHFAGRVDAESRLAAAIASGDEAAFGRALHTYQDYHSHILRGYTYSPGQAGVTELHELCPDCQEWTPEQWDTGERNTRCLGHFLCLCGNGTADTFDPLTDLTDQAMIAGTEYWTLAFMLVKAGIPFEEWGDYGIDPELYQERIPSESERQ